MKINGHEIDFDALLEQFGNEYEFLYDTHCSGKEVAGEDEAMEFGDMIIQLRPDVVSEFARIRQDFLSSDREVAAFGFAINELYGD